MIENIEAVLSAYWWVGVIAVAILVLFRETIGTFLSAKWWIGVGAIVAILAFLFHTPQVPEQPRLEQPRPEQPRLEQPRPEQPRPEQPRPEQPRPEKRAFAIPGDESVEMVWIEPGTFDMGCPSDRDCKSDEKPVHSVSISKGFWMGKYEVTQGQWEAVMKTTPWSGKDNVRSGSDYPAVYISWHDAQKFIRRLNMEADSNVYRLPTEAEWEYACRAGTTTRWSFGDDESQLTHYAWYDSNAKDVDKNYAHKVGKKRANPWGLYDIHGNVTEWVQDLNQADYYTESPTVDPTGPATGSSRVARGGAIGNLARGVWSVDRGGNTPDFRGYYTGFRLLRQVNAFGKDMQPDKIYWAEDGKIRRANLDGSYIEDVVTNAGDPDGLALDVSAGKVYWIDRSPSAVKIRRANLDGSKIENLVTTRLSQPIEIALDVSAGKMYWIDHSTGKVQRANLDGSKIEDLFTGVDGVHGLALDVLVDKMYLGGIEGDKIILANLDGSQVEAVATGVGGVHGLALDVSRGKMYWTWQNGPIKRANLDGSEVEDVVTDVKGARGIALDVSRGKMYWTEDGTNQGRNKIRRANLDGSQIKDVVTGLDIPRGIVLNKERRTGSF